MVRLYRKEKGEIAKEELECKKGDKKIYLSVGDLIEFSKNDKALAVTNGILGTLIEATPEKFVVSVKEGSQNREITFNPVEYSSFQLGYATTYNRSQGKTIDRAYVLHSPRLNKESFYVGLTRHVQKAYLFVPKDNMHYLSYLKAKACGFRNNYQTFLNTNDHFQSKSQEEYITQLKEQVTHPNLKESIDNYQTSQENRISELKNSDSFFSKLKGYALTARNKISDIISGHYYANKADNKFFNPVIEKEAKVVVAEIENEELFGVETKIEINKSVILNAMKVNQGVGCAI